MNNRILFESSFDSYLLGLSITSLISFLAAIGTQHKPKQVSIPLHIVISGIYLPIIAFGVNRIPLSIISTSTTGWLVLSLCFLIVAVSHTLIFVLHQNKKRLATKSVTISLLTLDPPPKAEITYVLANTNVMQYRNAIVSTEEKGKEFAYIQRRIAPYFYPEDVLRLIAKERFGAGNIEMNAYINSNNRRKQAFFNALEAGARYREMFQRELIELYVRTGTHWGEMWPISPNGIVSLLKNWRETLLRHPNYFVGITEQSLPLKYHLINNECLILHEPVGKGDDFRLNSLFIYSAEVGSQVAKDFDIIWGLIDPKWRDRNHIANWIKEELIPLAKKRVM